MATMSRLFSLLIILLPETMLAQSILRGQVTDIKSEAVAYASVYLFSDDKLVATTITNDAGRFEINCACTRDSVYILKISSVGFLPFVQDFIYDDGLRLHYYLTADKAALKNVVVTTARPLIIRKADRYVINVENSFLSNSNSALDVLQKSPGIWVDGEGRIRIGGNQPVMVMINDVVQRMSEDELSEYLRILKPENISKIEVIHSPPAEFEASGTGGIIHIVLKKNQRSGLNGSINGRLSKQGSQLLTNSGASLDFKMNRFSVFANYAYTRDNNLSYGRAITIYPDSSVYKGNTDRSNKNTRLLYRFGGLYEFSRNQSLGIQVMTNSSRLVTAFNTELTFASAASNTAGQALSDWIREPEVNSTTINYSWNIDTAGRSFKVIADYTGSGKEEINHIRSLYTDPILNRTYRNHSSAKTGISTLQGDYTHPLSPTMELKSGVKYADIERDNTVLREDYINDQWEKNDQGSNRFIYNERLMMAYLSIEKSIRNTNLKAGLRGENTHVKGRSMTSVQNFERKYFGIFPSFFLLHTLNAEAGNSVYLAFTKRLERPSFSRLNPFRLQFDDYRVLVGNPDLLPQYSQKIEVGGTYHNSITGSVYFIETKNIIGETSKPIAGSIVEFQFENFDHSREFGLTGSAQIKLLKHWNTSNSISLFRLAYVIGENFVSQSAVSLKSVHAINLKNIIDVNLIGEYRSAYLDGNARIAHLISFDVSVARKILKGKGRIRLYCSDVPNTLRDQSTTIYNKTYLFFYQKRQTQTFSVSLTYNFTSGKKVVLQKIEQNNEEEKSRIGN